MIEEQPRRIVGDAAPDAELQSETGPVRLSDYWREQPTVLVFVRHFG